MNPPSDDTAAARTSAATLTAIEWMSSWVKNSVVSATAIPTRKPRVIPPST
jgi:hypothetical protein